MGSLEQHGFDECDLPICPTDITIDILDIRCASANTLFVSWIIIDNTGGDLLGRVNFNALTWSCEDQNLDNTVFPFDSDQTYKASFDISSCLGTIWFKIKVRVGISFFHSALTSFNIAQCLPDSDTAVRASWCGDCPDVVGNPPAYMLYARSSTIPSYPVYFSYGGSCWKILDNSTETFIEGLPEGSIVTDIDTTYSSCINCCSQQNCPSPWTDLGDGDLVGTFYFEYQTYTIKDRLYVIKNWEVTDCDLVLPPPEKILFDTGCIGTDQESSPSFFVATRQCLEYNRATYGFCVHVRQSELPIGIVVDCNCDNTSGTYWRICSIDPDGETFSWQGSDECLCDSAEGSWFCETIDAPCVWRSESGGYATQALCEANCLIPKFSNVGHIEDGGRVFGVWGDGTYIYSANLGDGLRAYTFNEIDGFNNVGHIDDGGNARRVWGDGAYIYLANDTDGLRAYTFNEIDGFNNVGHIDDVIGNPIGIWGEAGDNPSISTIYSAVQSSGLRAYAFDGTAFIPTGDIDDGGSAQAIWGDGTYIYLANLHDGLRAYTFDGSNFNNVGHIDDGGDAFGVWGDGAYIYLANSSDGLRAYTFNEIDGFNNVGHIDDDDTISVSYGVWGDGSYIYLADGTDGLRAYTFDGSTFTLKDTVAESDPDARQVWGDGAYIYLANDTDGLRAYTFG